MYEAGDCHFSNFRALLILNNTILQKSNVIKIDDNLKILCNRLIIDTFASGE